MRRRAAHKLPVFVSGDAILRIPEAKPHSLLPSSLVVEGLNEEALAANYVRFLTRLGVYAIDPSGREDC